MVRLCITVVRQQSIGTSVLQHSFFFLVVKMDVLDQESLRDINQNTTRPPKTLIVPCSHFYLYNSDYFTTSVLLLCVY